MFLSMENSISMTETSPCPPWTCLSYSSLCCLWTSCLPYTNLCYSLTLDICICSTADWAAWTGLTAAACAVIELAQSTADCAAPVHTYSSAACAAFGRVCPTAAYAAFGPVCPTEACASSGHVCFIKNDLCFYLNQKLEAKNMQSKCMQTDLLLLWSEKLFEAKPVHPSI